MTIEFSADSEFQTKYEVLLPPSEKERDQISQVLLEKLSLQDEIVTISWPSYKFTQRETCETRVQISVEFLGMQAFGQTVSLDDQYLSIDTKSAELNKITTSIKTVIVSISAILYEAESEDE